MIETIQTTNGILALGGLATVIVAIFLIVDLTSKRIASSYIKTWGLHTAFFATLSSVFFTLLYSEYFGIVPCGLCWFERIALYPQLILLGIAIYYNDVVVPRYGIALSIFGLVISLYHHLILMGGTTFIKCPASGADCAKRFFFEYGFMTFPLMAVFLFVFLIVIYIYILKTRPV